MGLRCLCLPGVENRHYIEVVKLTYLVLAAPHNAKRRGMVPLGTYIRTGRSAGKDPNS